MHSCSEFRAGHCTKKTRQAESEGPTRKIERTAIHLIDPAKFPKFLSPKKLRQSENEQGRRRRGWEAAAARRGQGEQGGGARAALALAGRGAALERAARARSVGPLRLSCLALLNGAPLATGGTPGTPRTFLPVLGPLPTVWDDGHVWNDGWHAVRLPAAAGQHAAP